MSRPITSLVDRFWKKWTIEQTGCWKWSGYLDKNGRGRLLRNNIKDNHILAHRLSYLLFYGPIPDNLKVCHKCDNPSCVNPEHLFLGTQTDNIKDCVYKQRHSFGERNGRVKLKERDVRMIVYMWRTKEFTQREIADIYNISRCSVKDIVNRRRWKYIWRNNNGMERTQ